MRDIRSIIEELRSHPDHVVSDIFTMDDVLEHLQDQIADKRHTDMEYLGLDPDKEEDYELNIDDLSVGDKQVIIDYMENIFDHVWGDVDGIYPNFDELPDLVKKVERDINLIKILKK